ncbi:MAG: nucleotide exchange factor GrpE [Phycisphaerales bacterium]|jgi:molecular chaperone GrpE|nr:nucleotide exchange factor GrpE [Planctomycetota bacterium]
MSAPEARENHEELDDAATEAFEQDAGSSESSDEGDEYAALNERYLRMLADYQNFQRRTLESEPRIRSAGIASIARSLVPALDQFDLALAAAGDAESLRAGMRLIRSELLKGLAANGVEAVEPAVGDAFDPNLHEAVLRQPPESGAEVEPGSISMVLQAGYRLGDMVIRPAKVGLAPGEED